MSVNSTRARPAHTSTLPFIHPDDMPDLYALTGVGRCMEPIIADGAVLAFDKREEPAPGDIVGLIFTPEGARRHRLPGMIKRLVMCLPPAGFDGLIVVEMLNPAKTLSIPSTDVLAVHKCVGRAISQGGGRALFDRNQKGF